MLQLSQHYHLATLEEQCLGLMADRLAPALGHWRTVVLEEALAELDSGTLARLLGKTLQSVERVLPIPKHVFDVADGSGGSVGGFTFAIPAFSQLPTEPSIYSPWVEIGGFQWRLRIIPGGSLDGQGTHLSGEWQRAWVL